MAAPGRVPRIAGCRRISLLRRPLTKKALRRFTFGFVKKEIELARGGVGIHLLVPSPLFAYTKPLDDAPVFFRVRPSIAASISSIRLTLEVYHHPALAFHPLPGSGHWPSTCVRD